MKETFTRIWFTLYQEGRRIKVRLADMTTSEYIFRDSQGQRYVIPKIKISEFISYKYLNNENLLSLIDILNTGDTIVDVENVIQNYKKRYSYSIINGYYIRSFNTQSEVQGYFWAFLMKKKQTFSKYNKVNKRYKINRNLLITSLAMLKHRFYSNSTLF